MQSGKSVAVWRAGTDISLVATGERTMNKFITVPWRLPSIMKHKVSMRCPVCSRKITFQQIAELGLIGMDEQTEEDRLLINLAKVRANVLGPLTAYQVEARDTNTFK